MSAPGFTNLNSSVSYSQNSTPNGGAAPPYHNGPAQTYTSSYPAAGYYGAPPQQHSYPTIPAHSTPVPNKAPVTNSAHSANYYQNNHQQQPQQQHLPQHHVAPSQYTAPHSSAPPQPYTTLPSSAPPPSNAQYNQQPFQQPHPPPYATPGSYYGQQLYHAPAAQHPQQQQQPSLVPAPANSPGAPLYPIVSYPSAPGSSQYGTLSSSQTTSTPGVMPTQMSAPLHQYSTTQPASTTAVQPGYSVAPPGQVAPTVNGQGSTAQNTVHQHYDQSHQASLNYDSYGRVTHSSSGGADTDRPPSGTPSTSVHSSPGHRQGMQYGYVANSGASSAPATTSGPAAAPSSSSSEDDDDEEEDEDEEAGGDTSSSTTGSASPVPNSYDSLEGAVIRIQCHLPTI